MIRDPEFILNFLSALYIADLVTGADSVNDSKLFLTKPNIESMMTVIT